MEKFIEYLAEAERIIKTADHLIYMTFPLVKDKKLLLKILSETKIVITNIKNVNHRESEKTGSLSGFLY